MTAPGAKRPFQRSAVSGVGVLRDRNDLEFLTGCTCHIPNSFAQQKPCHWGCEGNGTGLRVRFVLSHDTIFLYAPKLGDHDDGPLAPSMPTGKKSKAAAPG